MIENLLAGLEGILWEVPTSGPVATLIAARRAEAQECPSGSRTHRHLRLTAAGLEAYRLDALARGGVTP